MASFNSTLRRQWRLIVFIIGLILIFWAMWALRGILLPFVLGFIFAVMVLPVIRWIERHFPVLGKRQRLRKLLRSIAVIIIYIIAVAIIGLFIFYLINIISNAIGTIRGNTSQLLPNGIDTIRNWLKSLPFLSSPTMQNTIDKYFNDIGSQLPSLLVSFLTKGWQYISGSINTIAGFIVLPLFIFYLLYDWERLRDNFYGGMSPWMRTHTIAVISILQDVVVRYIRGELILGITVGLAAWIMLTAFGIKAAFPLAIFFCGYGTGANDRSVDRRRAGRYRHAGGGPTKSALGSPGLYSDSIAGKPFACTQHPGSTIKNTPGGGNSFKHSRGIFCRHPGVHRYPSGNDGGNKTLPVFQRCPNLRYQ